MIPIICLVLVLIAIVILYRANSEGLAAWWRRGWHGTSSSSTPPTPFPPYPTPPNLTELQKQMKEQMKQMQKQMHQELGGRGRAPEDKPQVEPQDDICPECNRPFAMTDDYICSDCRSKR
jgi:hypothetical protein